MTTICKESEAWGGNEWVVQPGSTDGQSCIEHEGQLIEQVEVKGSKPGCSVGGVSPEMSHGVAWFAPLLLVYWLTRRKRRPALGVSQST